MRPRGDRGLFLLIHVYSLPLVGLGRVLDHGNLTASPPMDPCSSHRATSHELRSLQHALEVAGRAGVPGRPHNTGMGLKVVRPSHPLATGPPRAVSIDGGYSVFSNRRNQHLVLANQLPQRNAEPKDA
jgi:hypothetical protein